MHLQKSTTVYILLAVAFLLVCGSTRLFAQAANFPTGARSAGMAGAIVASSDVWATFNNPAMLAQINEIQAGLNYENRFMVRELGISSLSAVLPVNAGAFGLAFNQFGSNLYSQSFLGVSYGRRFTDRFQAGMRLDARHTRLAEEYGRRTNVSFAIGFAANLADDLVLGAALFNPLRIKSAEDFGEQLPAIYRAGFAYQIENNFTITFEAEKDVRYKPTFRAGIEYRFKEVASVRAGIGANPLNHAFGFGFHFRNFVFDIAALRHEVLGYSPQASIIWIAK